MLAVAKRPRTRVFMAEPSIAERRMRLEQALANARIEGHVPTQEFLDDMAAKIEGRLTSEQVRERILARWRDAGAGGVEPSAAPDGQ